MAYVAVRILTVIIKLYGFRRPLIERQAILSKGGNYLLPLFFDKKEVIKVSFLNPLKTGAGLSAAWFLYQELGRPFRNFDQFKNLLTNCIMRKASLYRMVKIPKRNLKVRKLFVPCRELKIVQKRINSMILAQEPRHPNAYGFSGGNVIKALMPIAESKQPVFATDVKDAFPSTKGKTVFNVFLRLGYGFYSAYFLTCATTWPKGALKNYWESGLPQGAPTSPRLFDLAFEHFDKKLSRLAERVGGHYSRYADNLFFTAPTFWPARKVKHYEKGITKYKDKWGTDSYRPYKIRIEKIPEDEERYIRDEGYTTWFAPLINAIYEIVQKGYENSPKIKWSPGYYKFVAFQAYNLHKSYLARKGTILHALGLNLIKGELHNTREFKRRLRMTIFNLQKALEQKDLFEEKIWPLYLKLNGMMNFAIKETLPQKLVAQWEEIDETVTELRYSGPSHTWSRIGEY